MRSLSSALILTLMFSAPVFTHAETIDNFTFSYVLDSVSQSYQFSIVDGSGVTGNASLGIPNLVVSGVDPAVTAPVTVTFYNDFALSFDIFPDPNTLIEILGGASVGEIPSNIAESGPPAATYFAYYFRSGTIPLSGILETTYDGVEGSSLLSSTSLTITQSTDVAADSTLLTPADATSAAVTPEPSSLALLGTGLAGMAAARWRRRRSRGSVQPCGSAS